jgi:uncharacterized protein YegL
MSLVDNIAIPRRVMTLFLIIDTSYSMEGSKIGSVNSAIEEVIPMLREVSEENADALIKIAVLEFSSGVKWLTPNGPVELDQFHWDHVYASGLTDFGAACVEIAGKLSTKAFMKEASGSYVPVFLLLSDGGPTDEWESRLSQLKSNNWFKVGIKLAVAIGDDADYDVLAEFTGSHEAVLMVHNAVALKKSIKFLVVSSTEVASKTTNVGPGGDEQKQIDVNKAVQEANAEIAQSDDGKEW